MNITQTAILSLCPRCGGSDIEEKGVNAFCQSCTWHGPVDELLVSPFKHELGSDEQIFKSMVTDLRNLLAKEFAKSFGAFLKKWGFISDRTTAVELSRYVVGVAKSTMHAIIEVRREIEQERVS